VLAQRGLTSFVGRQRDLDQLLSAWERVAYAGYSRLCRRSGDDEQAGQYLAQARQIFERLGTVVEPELVS
jgi:hypothetical protein